MSDNFPKQDVHNLIPKRLGNMAVPAITKKINLIITEILKDDAEFLVQYGNLVECTEIEPTTKISTTIEMDWIIQ